MEEILKMIDEEIDSCNEIIKQSHGMELDTRSTIGGLQVAKRIIQERQKANKGCYVCNDTSNDRYYRNQGYKYCPHCGALINQTVQEENNNAKSEK